MPNSNLTDLMSGIPGDYAFHLQAYDRTERFQADLDAAKHLCEERGFFFNAVAEPQSQQAEAFFVHVRR